MTFWDGYHVAVEGVADGVVVHLVGHLPDGESCLHEGILGRVAQPDAGRLYVDCSVLQSLGHPGVADLVRLGKLARGRGGQPILCRVPPSVGEVLAICRLDRLFDYRAEAAPGSQLRWVDASWLSWNGGAVRRIAQSICEQRAVDRLPVLADALEQAGCTNGDILSHCRTPGPHRGCWVVDLMLRQEP